MASLPEVCGNKQNTKSFLDLIGNSSIVSLCQNTDTSTLSNDLQTLANITAAMAAAAIPNIPGIPKEFIKEIPTLLANIPSLQSLAEMDGANPDFVKIVNGLAPLKGMAINDPKLADTLMEKTVLSSLITMYLNEALINGKENSSIISILSHRQEKFPRCLGEPQMGK